MGYDMYVRGADNGTEHAYLRRNIFSGARFADALIDFGMGFVIGRDFPAFPQEQDFGCEFKEWQDENGEWHYGVVGDRADEYNKALAEHLAWHGPDPERPGIPVHKVAGSNDGWHVTKEECQQALDAYRAAIAAGREHPAIFDDDAIPFLECAAQHDGFETH